MTIGVVAAAAAAVVVAAVIRSGSGGSGASSHTTTTLGLGEALGASAETQGPAFPKGSLHPGALNDKVTQANIHTTICSATWVRAATPDAEFLQRLEIRQLADEGNAGTAADYTEDHLVPVELGGSPRDPRNLWPEPFESKGARLAPAGGGAESKDTVEHKLHDEVCAGKLTLRLARQAIAANWQLAGIQF